MLKSERAYLRKAADRSFIHMAHISTTGRENSNRHGIRPVAAGAPPELKIVTDPEPNLDIRSMIDQLEDSCREARASQRIAEDERDRLADELARLQEEVPDNEGLSEKILELTAEREQLLQQSVKNTALLADLKLKAEASTQKCADISKNRDEMNRHRVSVMMESEAIARQRDDAIKARDALKKEKEVADADAMKLKRQLAAAERDIAAARKAAAESTANGDAQKQVISLRRARDAASAQVTELKEKVFLLEEQIVEINERFDAANRTAAQAADVSPELKELYEEAINRAGVESARSRELQRELDAKNEELAVARAEIFERTSHASSEAELRLTTELDAAVTSLTASEAELEAVTRERDSMAADAEREKAAADLQIREYREEIARLKVELESARPMLAEYEVIAGRFERQRIETIELSAQLEKAQRDIREMAATIAEARLLAKSAGRSAPAKPKPVSAGGDNAKSQDSERVAVDVKKAESDQAKRDTVTAMRKTFQQLFLDIENFDLLSELSHHAECLSVQALKGGEVLVNHVAVSFAALLHDLECMPEQLSPAMLRTLNQTIEFLAAVLTQESPDSRVKLGDMRVYVVDDDAGSCEAVASSIEAAGMSVRTTQLPGEAVGDLAENRYDLVIIDIELPEVGGFELSTYLRQMDLHAETPIAFLTGDASSENRSKSTQHGGGEFFAKPFNFQELGLRVLMFVLRSKLNMTLPA